MPTNRKALQKITKMLERLNHYIALIRYDWTTYRALYSDVATKEVLDRSAPPFFSSLRFGLRSTVVLSLARLFDMSTPTQENLTLYSLLVSVKEVASADFILSIEKTINEARVEAERIRQERHKRIAHLDIEAVFDGRMSDVPEEQITKLLERVEVILNQVDLEIRGGTHYHHVYADMAKSHVAQLIEKLRVGDL